MRGGRGRRGRTSRARTLGLAAGGALLVAGPAPGPAAGQVPDTSSPATVAEEFERGFQSMAWAGLAQRLHPDALAYLRYAVDVVVDADTTGWALERLLGGVPSREALAGMADAEVFRRVMRGVQEEVPGLLSSLVSRRSEVLGAVAEGDTLAHVVHRVVALVQGAEPEVRVLTLARTTAGWKVREAEEVRVLHTAIRRVPIPRRGAGNAPGLRRRPEPLSRGVRRGATPPVQSPRGSRGPGAA